MKSVRSKLSEIFETDNFKYIINSHGHWDHTGGNLLFENSEIVAHENAVKYMEKTIPNSVVNSIYALSSLRKAEEKLASLNPSSDEVKSQEELVRGWKDIYKFLSREASYNPPTKMFRDKLALKSGQFNLELYNCGYLHTSHDIITYLPEESVLITGDIFNSMASFSFDVDKIANVPELIQLLKNILHRDPDLKLVITSHGEAFPGSELYRTVEFLQQRYSDLPDKKSAAQYLKLSLETNKFPQVKRIYEKEISSSSSEYYKSENEYNNLAEQLMSSSRLEEAIGVLEITVKEFPKSIIAYDNLGRAYINKGDKKNSVFFYEKSLELFPSNNNTKEIIKFLTAE